MSKIIALTEKLNSADIFPSIFYVYTPTQTIAIKGFYQFVRDYIEKNYPKSIYNAVRFYSIIVHKKDRKVSFTRSSWGSPLKINFIKIPRDSGKYPYNLYTGRFEDVKLKPNRECICIEVETKEGKKNLVVRRVPRKWLPIYDEALEEQPIMK